MKATVWRSGAAVLLLIAAVGACTTEDDREPNRGIPTTIQISPASATLSYIHESTSFFANVFDQNGSDLYAPVFWSVSDTAILAVTGDSVSAVVTARANGSAMLLATAEEAVDTVTVTVRQTAGGLEVVSGNDQVGLQGTTLSEPLVVGVVDAGGTIASGVEIAFTPAEGSGTVSDTLAETDAQGRATTQWTLGDARRQSVAVAVGDLRQRFTATANSDPPMPDYALLEGLDFTRQDPLDTDIIEVSATISNLGDGAGPARFPVRLSLDGVTLANMDVDHIAPGEAATVIFTLGPLERGRREVGLEIDPAGGITEWEEENNLATGILSVVRQREIALGESVTLESSTADEVFLFRVEVPEGSDEALNIELSGGSGDADVFGHYDERPGYRYLYRCFGVDPETDELCQMVPARTGTYHIAVHAFTAFGPSTLTVTIGEKPVDPFDIELVFLDGGTGEQRGVIEKAARRWESVIARDVFDWDHAAADRVPAGTCGPGSPAVADRVDDIRVFVTVGSIDGPGNTVAQSGPCWVRPHPVEGAEGIWLQPTLAAIYLDAADVALIESEGMLESFATHELAHALGFVPEVWNHHDRLRNPSIPHSPGADTHFAGPRAVAAFDAAGGAAYARAKVPVENGATEGFSDSHWRESVFGDELMSPLLTGDVQPLSLITIESLYDIGYEVNVGAADEFEVRGAGARVVSGGGG
ncbi:MAG: hypothetical protein F4X60_10680, partial [Gemmatimonadetes bacterium]|nr:hypothetical protein [Gemmatimonadota bacterium]